MKRILVPTDFSKCADNATRYAIHLATKTNSELIIAHVSPVPAGGDVLFYVDTPIIGEKKQSAIKQFDAFKKSTPQLAEIKHEFKFEFGFPVEIIKEWIKKLNIDLTVIGNRGATNNLDEFFGTTADDIINHSECPVLCVPENAPAENYKEIALALDYEDQANDHHAEMLRTIASALGCSIHIITIMNGQTDLDHYNEGKITQWDNIFDGINHHFHIIEDGNIEHGILNYSGDNNIDMIAVTPSRRSLVYQLFHKSVSHGLVHHSRLPLLVIK